MEDDTAVMAEEDSESEAGIMEDQSGLYSVSILDRRQLIDLQMQKYSYGNTYITQEEQKQAIIEDEEEGEEKEVEIEFRKRKVWL